MRIKQTERQIKGKTSKGTDERRDKDTDRSRETEGKKNYRRDRPLKEKQMKLERQMEGETKIVRD